MTPAIRAELLFDEREVVVSALNRTMLIDPDSSTQRYLNNPSGYAMWDVNKHRNSHFQASWVYQRQFYTVHVEKSFTQSCVLQSGEPCCEQLSLLRVLSYLFMRLSPVTSLSQFEICCWKWNSEYRCEHGDLWIPNAFIYSTDVSENPFIKSLKPWIKPTNL